MDDSARERWRGSVDAKIEDLERNQTTLFRLNVEVNKSCRNLELKAAEMGVKLAIYSAIGACFGGGAVAWVFTFIRHP